MKRSVVLSAGALLCVLSIAAAASEADLAAVAAASRAWDEAYAAGDAAKLADRYDSEAVSMPPGLQAIGPKTAIEADFHAFFAAHRATHRTYDADRRVLGDHVIERARYEATIIPKDGGATLREAGKHIVVYRRQDDGSWKVLWEIWNSDGGQ